MSTYTPTAVKLGNITQPADGETIEAVDVNAPDAAIADGVKFLNDRTDPLSDLSALAAIAAPSDGTARHVVGSGWYVFKTSATTGISPFRVAAADATPGGWLSSTAHQTTLVRSVPCNRGVYISTNGAGAAAPVAVGVTSAIDFGVAGIANVLISDRGFYPLTVNTGVTTSYAWAIPIDEFLVDGASLISATLYCRPVGGHAAMPSRQPWMGIIRTVRTGYAPAPAPLLSTGTGVVQLAAVSTAAYQTDLTLAFVPDQNNTIDRSQYSYLAVIGDEGGTNATAGNRFAQISLAMSSIADARR